MTKDDMTQENIGRRIIYTSRGNTLFKGTIRGYADGTNFVDVDLDSQKRDRNYVPCDMVELIEVGST